MATAENFMTAPCTIEVEEKLLGNPVSDSANSKALRLRSGELEKSSRYAKGNKKWWCVRQRKEM